MLKNPIFLKKMLKYCIILHIILKGEYGKIMTRQDLINKKNNEIETLKNEIREICFEHIKAEKDIVLGDFIEIPSKNKFAVFSDLHTESADECVIKTFILTRLGLPSKKVTTFKLDDVQKINKDIKDVINENFSGEEFDADAALDACLTVQKQLSK